MASFLGELKRRKVFQVAVVYAVVAWLIVQVVDAVNEPLSLPGWLDTVVIVLLLAGFPVALVLAWALDLTPRGIVRTPPSDHNERAETKDEPTPDGREVEREVLPNSVAVLPFENLSPNPDDAYFAAGIHEELLNQLARIRDLRVIARTSVMQYEGARRSISEIANELRVGTVMEGSVRYAGDRVRVIAQLIDATTEDHLWSEVYERDLADTFAIQADIAARIANALEAEFTLAEQQRVGTPLTASPEAYARYLRAMAIYRELADVTAPPRIRSSVQSYLDQAIALDPEFAAAHARQASVYAASRAYDPIKEEDWITRSAELNSLVSEHAEKALALDPNLGPAYWALALNHQFNSRAVKAQEAYKQALQLIPNDPNGLIWYSSLLWMIDRFEDAIRLGERAVELDPNNYLAYVFLGVWFNAAGNYAAAVDILRMGTEIAAAGPSPHLHLAIPEINQGNYTDALDALRVADQLMPDEAAPNIRAHLAYLYGRLGRREDARRVFNQVKAMAADRYVGPPGWAWGYLAVGENEQALAALNRAIENPALVTEPFPLAFIKHNDWTDPVLEQPEFVEVRSRLGFRE